MDQGTPSNFYLTLCLYVSFYFLFFTTSTTTSQLLPIIPTSQELNEKRRAKSFSEQLDPFLAATRQAQTTQQVKGIAKARAKATLGTVRGYHSRQHSRQHSSSQPYSNPHSRQHSKTSSSIDHPHSRQHSRQKSHHSQSNLYGYHSVLNDIPGSYFKASTNKKTALTNSADLDFQVHQHQHSRENTRLYHQHQLQQHNNPHSNQGPSFTVSPHPQRYKPRHSKLARVFPRQNQNRYYHFYPEPLFHKQKKMTIPATTSTPTSATEATSSSHGPTFGPAKPTDSSDRQTNDWNSVTLDGTPSEPKPQQPRNSIGWADGVQGQAQQQQARRDSISAEPILRSQGGSTRVGPINSKCHLEESVTPPTLLAHLRLLRLVQSLVIVDDEDLDFLFLIRSEERYLMYLDLLQQLEPSTDAIPLPPLDVALMWTVHMLAPFRYHEDLLRSYGPHMLNYTFPLERYVASIDIENPTTDHEAFLPSKEMWRQLYPDEAFDLDKDDTDRMFEIQCLWCGGTNVMDSSTYIKFRIDGMSIDCAGCGSQCSLETLSSKRLWDGIEAYRADSSMLLAGSLLSPWTGTADPTAAQREHHHLFFHPRIQFGLDQTSVSLNCTWPKVIQAFQDLGPDQYYGIRPTTLARIMSSYMGLIEDRLSMDLVAGALRQRDFQKAMMVTGGQAWCQPQVLQRSLDRYKKFMILARAESKHTGGGGSGSMVAGMTTLSAGGGSLGAGQPGRHALVPTLDIDLAWHTHMLSPAHYRQYQLVHYGRVLNHDDTVQATSAMTKQDFVRTAELWQELYQERYSSQQTWRGAFVMTPQKLCAGVCFPPYGAYLIWKNWSSKMKARKLNRSGEKQKRQKEKGKKSKKIKKHKDDKDQEKEVSVQTSEDPGLLSGSEKHLDLRIEELMVQEDVSPEKQVQDTKGKGKVVDDDEQVATPSPVLESSVQDTDSQRKDDNDGKVSPNPSNRSLTPALGLDGRISNWNGDATGPDGQASCSSGACIMSPWNELQDIVPYVDLQPQQQRELRRERT